MREVHQFRKRGAADWYDGKPDDEDGGGPYEQRTLYEHAPMDAANLEWVYVRYDVYSAMRDRAAEYDQHVMNQKNASQPAPAADTGQAVAPTPDMIEAGARKVGGGSNFDHEDRQNIAREVYRAMVAARPAHPAPLDVERVREEDLVSVAKRILERGYISETIEEERADYLALRAALRQKVKP